MSVLLRLFLILLCVVPGYVVGAPLSSRNDTGPKKAIIAFIERVTKEGASDFVPSEQRIATFANDGTLWAEQPIYFQFQFAPDRVKALSSQLSEGSSGGRMETHAGLVCQKRRGLRSHRLAVRFNAPDFQLYASSASWQAHSQLLLKNEALQNLAEVCGSLFYTEETEHV